MRKKWQRELRHQALEMISLPMRCESFRISLLLVKYAGIGFRLRPICCKHEFPGFLACLSGQLEQDALDLSGFARLGFPRSLNEVVQNGARARVLAGIRNELAAQAARLPSIQAANIVLRSKSARLIS